MFIRRVLAQQLAKPSGLPGRFMGRALDRVNARVNRLALDALDLNASEQLLDVGFGGGLLIRSALERQPAVFVAGIDVSRPMIERGRASFRDAIGAGRVEVVEADVVSIPFADGRFDKAAAINTLHFWGDVRAGLKEVARVLRPGGRFVIAVRPKAFLERVQFTRLGFRPFTEEELRELLESAGFDRITIERHADKDMGTIQAIAHRPDRAGRVAEAISA